MDNRVPREYSDDVLYVYDRVCPKNAKKRQINRTYGNAAAGSNSANGRQSGTPPERVYGKAFAESQRQRADAAGLKNGTRTQSGQAESQSRTQYRDGHAYTYRPGNVGGGEAVKNRPLKLMIEKIANFFETIEERGRRDEAIAKQRAIAWKKFSEYRHILGTSLLLLAITVIFVLLVYKMFFVVEDVSVSGTEMYTQEEILASSGFAAGDNLYSFAAEDAEDAITFLCPYIKSAEVERTIPKSVAITLEDDTAAYCTTIWGDCVKLSAGLRVLEVVSAEEAQAEGLIELVLPPVKYSVTGRMIEFSDARNERFIRNVLTEVRESTLAAAGMIDAVDLSDEYDISLQSGGRYLLKIGDEADCDLKLRMAYKTMTDDGFDQLLPARIDLTEVGKAIIKPDASLSFD